MSQILYLYKVKQVALWIGLLAAPLAARAQGLQQWYNYHDSAAHMTPQVSALFPTPLHKTHQPQQLPSDLYTKNFGFFCRQELKMYKAHVPVSFRLGSMEQCDMLEQKGVK